MQKKSMQVMDIELIKALMKSRGIDEKEMASRLNVTAATVKRLLSGADQSHMSAYYVIRIAHALNVPPQAIIYKDYR